MRYFRICCVATTIATLAPSIAASQQKKLATYYSPDTVQNIHLQVKSEHLQKMKDALPKRIYVPGSFRWRDITITNVAVRYKGNSSSRPNQRHKRSFLIRFDKFKKGTRFLGLRRVSFDNGVQFGSLFSEPIVTEILRAEKIKTHRANHARVFLNKKFHGVYVNVERIDQSFIQHHLDDSGGSLFKVDLGGPGANLQFIGKNPEAYRRTFEPKSKSASHDLGRLVEFIRVINQMSSKEAEKRLTSNLELDDFLRTTAVMLFAGAFDQLTGWNPHNYYLFFDHKRKRWRYLPWDLDVGFSDNAFGRIRVIDEWNAAWPVTGGPPNPLLEKIIGNPELIKRYRRIASRILEEHFKPEILGKRLDAKFALIKDDLAKDPFPHRRATNPRDRDFAGIIVSMKSFFQKRYQTARKQLNEPGKRLMIVRRQRRPRRQPSPGPASKNAPTGLKVVIKDGRIQLSWKDNAKSEVAYIVQRASKTGPFRNHIGQPGDNITNATDRRTGRGETYRYRVYAVCRTLSGPKATGPSNIVTLRIP